MGRELEHKLVASSMVGWDHPQMHRVDLLLGCQAHRQAYQWVVKDFEVLAPHRRWVMLGHQVLYYL